MLSKKTGSDEQIAQLSYLSSLLYVLSIPHLDIEGRMIGAPETVRGVVVPALARARPEDWTDQLVAQYMVEWTATVDDGGNIDPLVLWYAANGISACQFTGFFNHQTLRRDREAPSRLPAPPPELLAQPALASAGMALSPALRRVIAHIRAPLRSNSGPEGEAEEETLHAGFSVARVREANGQVLQVAQTIEEALSSTLAPRPGLDLDTPGVVSTSGFGTRSAGEEQTPSDTELGEIVAGLTGDTQGTLHQLKVWRRRGCGEREFAIALESLSGRRGKKPTLESEARYVCSELSRLLREKESAAA